MPVVALCKRSGTEKLGSLRVSCDRTVVRRSKASDDEEPLVTGQLLNLLKSTLGCKGKFIDTPEIRLVTCRINGHGERRTLEDICFPPKEDCFRSLR